MVSFRNSTCIGEIGCGWKSRERQSPSGGGHTVNAWKRECNVLCAAGENRHSLLSLCPSFLLKHTPPLQLQLHPYWSQPPLLRTVEREKVRTLCRGKSLWSLHSRVCFSWASWVSHEMIWLFTSSSLKWAYASFLSRLVCPIPSLYLNSAQFSEHIIKFTVIYLCRVC